MVTLLFLGQIIFVDEYEIEWMFLLLIFNFISLLQLVS